MGLRARRRKREEDRLRFAAMPLLRFLHIPKTAGSTLGQSLSGYFREYGIRDYGHLTTNPVMPFLGNAQGYAKEILDREGYRSCIEKKRFKMLMSHGSFHRLSWLIPSNHTIVFFRNTVDRLVSEHAHIIRMRIERSKPAPEPLEEWIHFDNRRNYQSKNTEGLDCGLAFVGITELYEESVAALNERFGIRIGTFEGNVNPQKTVREPYKLDPALRKEIELLNEDDMALYERMRIIGEQTIEEAKK